MRASVVTALFAIFPAVLGWSVTLYTEPKCGDESDNFGYMIVEGVGRLDHCIGPGDNRFPPGVFCEWFGSGGSDGPHDCKGQDKAFKSFIVERGTVSAWAGYDFHDFVPDNQRCYAQLTFHEGHLNIIDKKPEDGCVSLDGYPENPQEFYGIFAFDY
ncbi:hypothetical protein FDECE_13248 [Fusarium decemcellulare]|nr:hypothetical protein FDECE_13248 [Fusarium decemcellulare]